MAKKKYLTLQEASEILGISEDRLKDARAKGDIRGFADRGNWKFRQEDVDEFGRTIQAHSDQDIPILDPDGDSGIMSGDIGPGSGINLAGDGNVLADDSGIGVGEEALSEQPTVIRKAGDSNIFGNDSDMELEGESDSGVRLVLDSTLTDAAGLEDSGADVMADQSNEIPLSFGDSDNEMDLEIEDASQDHDSAFEGSSVEIPLSFGDDSDDMGLAIEDDEGSSEMMDLGRSDSDVRLSVDLDDESLADSSSEVLLTGADSDSDVALLDQTQPMVLGDAGVPPLEDVGSGPGSDSDVAALDMKSDSDVRLMSDEADESAAGSDSDVRLIKTDSDSDVRLAGSDSDSDVRLLSPASLNVEEDSDSDVSLAEGTETDIRLGVDEGDSEEGISLGEDEDSGLTLGTDDSGIALEAADDSGISLDVEMDSGISLDVADDSGIALDVGTDSDITLAPDTDSGISLDAGGDSGISLDMPTDSGISLDQGDMAATAPAMGVVGQDQSDDATADTMVQMPAFDGIDDDDDESDFELGALEGDSSSDTSVLLFDDEDDAEERAATLIKKSGAEDEETFDLDAGEVFDEEFEDDEELIGEDDEIEDFEEFGDDEEFMADEDDFDESFATGESQAEFVAPVPGGAPRGAYAVEQEWGGFVFAAVLLSSVMMIVCCGVMFDLVRYIWQAGEYGVVAGPAIDMIGIK